MTVSEIEQLIKQLPSKSSHDHDEISNVLLKSLCKSISFPLCKIFNDSIMSGIFPEAMQQAKVIPLYNGKEMDVRMNYRPISLLITISKILEKIIYKRLYSFLNNNNSFFSSQYGFKNITRVNMRSLNSLVIFSKPKILASKHYRFFWI